MKALVGAFNQEKALVGAFSVIVQLHRLTDLRHYPAPWHHHSAHWAPGPGAGDKNSWHLLAPQRWARQLLQVIQIQASSAALCVGSCSGCWPTWIYFTFISNCVEHRFYLQYSIYTLNQMALWAAWRVCMLSECRPWLWVCPGCGLATVATCPSHHHPLNQFSPPLSLGEQSGFCIRALWDLRLRSTNKEHLFWQRLL